MKTPNAPGWWWRDGKPTYVYAGIDGCSIRYDHFDESGAIRPGRPVTDDGRWQGPCTRGTVIDGKRPTREQNDGVEKAGGYWLRMPADADVNGHRPGLAFACDGATVFWRSGLSYDADGGDDPGAIWHAHDAQGYPLDLEGAP